MALPSCGGRRRRSLLLLAALGSLNAFGRVAFIAGSAKAATAGAGAISIVGLLAPSAWAVTDGFEDYNKLVIKPPKAAPAVAEKVTTASFQANAPDPMNNEAAQMVGGAGALAFFGVLIAVFVVLANRGGSQMEER
eukprot:CAMPEP_0197651822 /NCGR_PEP_ID=MMETSP1338-20131121/34074_1 /TAXON_ID=43686 ORGANISM="Pelagodinium beii, Strain RCC1491" /NCGR_SAMPLE_ID=MMETSP1338 /ASSEMBLY_ACC=CAM_ASM_000754 /LENGTH=135 /DNA_ID=CAMNT_0043226563 /DNA_START=26 /DNA_END=433 /DNA_ORIENTATION=+